MSTLANGRVIARCGDSRELLAQRRPESVSAIVTDPPYELGFMGKTWDNSGIAFDPTFWAECLRVLKPGGHLLAFGGTRTFHRIAVAIEDAGFEIRDSIAWMYGTGFPKSLDVSKAIDAAAGATRQVVGLSPHSHDRTASSYQVDDGQHGYIGRAEGERTLTAPATDDAKQWQGWGTTLKPAHEPIIVARKPLIGTVAANVLAHGTGALNIDATRIGTEGGTSGAGAGPRGAVFGQGLNGSFGKPIPGMGRWPANVVLDEGQAAALDEQSGYQKDGVAVNRNRPEDGGGASRFFYCAKAPKKERPVVDGVAHATVKPLALMRYLVRLVTPPDGIVLDPFAGSGTSLEAAYLEGFRSIGYELTPEHMPLILARLAKYND